MNRVFFASALLEEVKTALQAFAASSLPTATSDQLETAYVPVFCFWGMESGCRGGVFRGAFGGCCPSPAAFTPLPTQCTAHACYYRIRENNKLALAKLLKHLDRGYDEVAIVESAFGRLCELVHVDNTLTAAFKNKDEAALDLAISEADALKYVCRDPVPIIPPSFATYQQCRLGARDGHVPQ